MRWQFDAKVAAEFDEIAQRHIPNYDIVLGRCVALALVMFKGLPAAKIIDVGSARGATVKRLVDAGFHHVWGVESSPHMKAASVEPERIILSAEFPVEAGPFDMVLANWTLHFIQAREEYIRNIYRGLKPSGLFIFSDRMLGSQVVYEQYLDFKRSRGVGEKEIADKEAALQGVLEARPLSWYQDTLTRTGFVDVEIIDAAWCFNTVMCRKP